MLEYAAEMNDNDDYESFLTQATSPPQVLVNRPPSTRLKKKTLSSPSTPKTPSKQKPTPSTPKIPSIPKLPFTPKTTSLQVIENKPSPSTPKIPPVLDNEMLPEVLIQGMLFFSFLFLIKHPVYIFSLHSIVYIYF